MLRSESEIIENAVMFALIGMETGISVSWAHRNEQIYLYSTFLAIFFNARYHRERIDLCSMRYQSRVHVFVAPA